MVEWKKLGEVVSYYRGVSYNKKQEVSLNSGGTKILRANNITVETNTLNFDDVKEISSSVKIKEYQWLYPNDILICAGSGSKEHVGKVAYIYKTINYAYGGFMGKLVTSEALIPRYFFHVISSSLFKKYLDVALNATTINNLNAGLLNDFLIPIPSLEEQNRIVGILDTFTDSIENLKQQIAQRRKQFEFYRDQLLDLEGKEGVEMKTLGEICDIKGDYGISASSKPFDGNCRYIRITDITDSGSLNDDVVSADYNKPVKEALKEGDILFARTGATVGKTLLFHKEYGECLFAGYLIRYRVKTMIALPKFVFHFAHSNDYYKWVKANLVEGAQPNISALKYNSLQIPVPPLSEQSRIVSILDTFEASITNLEAQLAQRQKQYEYYRNQLLTFE